MSLFRGVTFFRDLSNNYEFGKLAINWGLLLIKAIRQKNIYISRELLHIHLAGCMRGTVTGDRGSTVCVCMSVYVSREVVGCRQTVAEGEGSTQHCGHTVSNPGSSGRECRPWEPL